MESRRVILENLRNSRALNGADVSCSKLSFYTPEQIFADIPAADTNVLLAQFTAKLTALKGEVHSVASLAAARQKIALIARESGLKSCGRQNHPLLDRLFTAAPELQDLESQMKIVRVGESLPHSSIEAMHCSFTVADALVARTGSIVLRATTAGGRRLSVLPPIHCVVAERSQLVSCLSPWLSNVHSADDWSYGTIITGPSRTADIERILVLGAHGPKRLIVIVVDQINE